MLRILRLLLVFAILPAAVSAQMGGRWALRLTSPGGTESRGELRLQEAGGELSGRVLFEFADSAWLDLRGHTRPDGVFELAAGGGVFRLGGRASNDELEGVLVGRGQPQLRWTGQRIRPDVTWYAAPPRFVLRQIVVGAHQSAFTVPGPWIAAAAAAGETPETVQARYRALAAEAGLPAIPVESLGTAGLRRAMGVSDRAQIVEASRRVLAQVRAGLRNDTALVRFDYLFRPGGQWQVDIHDVALARARRTLPTLSWEDTRAALRAAGQVGPSSPDAPGDLQLALYRLLVQAVKDSAAFSATRQQMQVVEPVSAAAVLALLRGYEEANDWYVQVMNFFLAVPWVPDEGGLASLVDLTRRFWGDTIRVPQVQIHLFGYPEGTSRAAADSSVVARVIQPLNAPALDWLAANGQAGLLTMVHRLRGGFGANTTLLAGTDQYQLMSPGDYASAAYNGFLESADVVLLDPSFEPVFALGTLVHEWQHILHQRRRGGAGLIEGDSGSLTLESMDPFLAEGLAEWATEHILEPVAQRFPLLALGEVEKRASLSPDDPHVLGYLLVRTLAGTLGSDAAVLALASRYGSDPGALVRAPELAGRWDGGHTPARSYPRRGIPALIPETEFLVEGMVPDIVATRVRAVSRPGE